ncbi:hypothetical protein MRX96_011430 [Rhipicephalus microplus]
MMLRSCAKEDFAADAVDTTYEECAKHHAPSAPPSEHTVCECAAFLSHHFLNFIPPLRKKGCTFVKAQGQPMMRDGAAKPWGPSRRRDPFKADLGAGESSIQGC